MGNGIREDCADLVKAKHVGNNVKEEHSAVGLVTTYSYDTAGKVTRIIQSDGTVDTIANASSGSQRALLDEHGKRTTYCYDPESNQIEILDAE